MRWEGFADFSLLPLKGFLLKGKNMTAKELLKKIEEENLIIYVPGYLGMFNVEPKNLLLFRPTDPELKNLK